jgi:hypothetical protein
MSDEIPMRQVSGGYVREDAYPGAGEPDWEQAYRDLAAVHEDVKTERDTALAKRDAQMRSASFLAGSLARTEQERLVYLRALVAIYSGKAIGTLTARDALAEGAEIARETRSTGAPAQNEAPATTPAGGPTPDAAHKPAQAVLVPPYSPHPEPCAADCGHPEHPAELGPPCGGSRCYFEGGEWRHTSKSYGSCAVSRGEKP